MQTVAENRFTVTEELFREGMERIMKTEYAPAVKKLLAVVIGTWLLLVGFTIWKGGSLVVTGIELLAVVVICVYMAVIVPRGRIKRGWKSMCQRSGGVMERVTRFYEDRMEIESGGAGALIVNYEDVTEVLETKHLLIFRSANKPGVMTALDGFTKGARDDVIALVAEWSR